MFNLWGKSDIKQDGQSQLNIELLAIEVQQMENVKKMIQIDQMKQLMKKEKVQQYIEFKEKLIKNIKEYMLPYGIVTTVAGIFVARSFVLGSLTGLFGGKVGYTVYSKCTTTQDGGKTNIREEIH